jgi:hypothetical protein
VWLTQSPPVDVAAADAIIHSMSDLIAALDTLSKTRAARGR